MSRHWLCCMDSTEHLHTLTDTRVTQGTGVIDLEAQFEPSLLNTAIYLLGPSQQVSTFTINFQGRPFREGIRENLSLYWGLVGASAVAFSGGMDFMPELNRWLQIIEMEVEIGPMFLCLLGDQLIMIAILHTR
ncbi:hypothetical protein EV424DRAFT_1570503 [Suillus variegatus]|nr:hypothetical protein EV424DRAFT_1570503 [Suillus variegatus]